MKWVDTELREVADIKFYLVQENEFAAPKQQGLVGNMDFSCLCLKDSQRICIGMKVTQVHSQTQGFPDTFF